jgi:hypothetical protein
MSLRRPKNWSRPIAPPVAAVMRQMDAMQVDARLLEYGYNWLTAAVCGLHGEGPNGFGCIADWHCKNVE